MKILLTGGTGFIGSAFLRHALARGHNVASLVSPKRISPAVGTLSENHVLLRGTLQDAPWEQIRSFQPDCCVHSAWIATPGVYLESEVNDDFLRWSLDFLTRFYACGGTHVVGIGTCIEYQLGSRRLSETETPTLPTTRYAKAKDRLRSALQPIADRAGGSTCWARLFYPYGPGEHPARLASQLIQKMRHGESATLATPNSVKDYIYIDDVADALVALVELEATGIYNVGSGTEASVKHIAGRLAQLLAAPTPQAANPAAAYAAPDYVVADIGRLEALGWRPKISLQTGLAQLVNSITQLQPA